MISKKRTHNSSPHPDALKKVGTCKSTQVSTLVSIEVEDRVATITINHPPANALNYALLAQLESALHELEVNDGVRVMIITGAGRVFIAGADIHMLKDISSSQQSQELSLTGQRIFGIIEASSKPVIAAINGACLGGGLELALCCHMRLASEDAPLGLPEINLGIIPGFGGTQRLPRIIGFSKATELILTGETISALEAKSLGLVSQVTSADDLLPQAMGLAQRIGSKGQLAIQAALQAIHQGKWLRLQEALAFEAQLFGKLRESADAQEGLTAFVEKRQPHFRGC